MNALTRSKADWVLPILLISFIMFRLLVLLTGGMHTFEAEELCRGTIGKEIIEGLQMPLWDYQADHYSGGSILSGLAAVPFFLLFGPSLFSLKLSPVLFAFLTLIFLWIFIKRNFGRSAAFFAALFYILAPPSFVRLSLVAMGFHSESILFSILTLYFFYRFFFEGRKTSFLFLFGLLSGLGFWFTHITIIYPLACLGAWVFRDPRSFFDRRNLGIFFGGAFLGLIPWVLYNFTHHFEGFGFIVRSLLHFRGTPGDVAPSAFSFDWVRLFRLAAEAIPLSFGFGGCSFLPRRTISLIYYGIGLALLAPLYVGFIRNIFSKKKNEFFTRLFPLLFIPPVFLTIYWLSAVELTSVTELEHLNHFFDDCRYFVPFQFSFFMLLGIACAESRWGKTAAWILVGFGLYGLAAISFLEPLGNVRYTKGYSYAQLGSLRGHIWPRSSPDFKDYLTKIKHYKMPDRFFVFWPSLYGLQFEKNLKDVEKVRGFMTSVAPEYRPHMAEGIGYGIGAQEGLRLDPKDAVMEAIPPEFHKYFYLGFFISTLFDHPGELEAHFNFAEKLSPEAREIFHFVLGQFCPFERKPGGLDIVLKRQHGETDADIKSFFRGIGVRASINWLIEGFTMQQALKNFRFEIPAPYQNDLYWGVGWALREQVAEDRPWALALLNELPAEKRSDALEGFETCEKIYAIPK